MSPHDALRHAIRQADGQVNLGRTIGVAQSTISFWLNSPRGVRAEYVIAIEQATGVSRHELRPDLYPAPSRQGAAA